MRLTRVREQLNALFLADSADATGEDEEGEPSWEPVIVFDSISRIEFRAWLCKHAGDLRCWCFEPSTTDMGRVVIYSRETSAQRGASSHIFTSILTQVAAIGDDTDLLRTISVMIPPTCELKDRDQQPASSLIPRELLGTNKPQQFPNLVIEVEFRNVSLLMLHEKLQRWMGEGDETNVQIAIGIKIYERSQRRVAILRTRYGATQTVEFGVGGGNPAPLVFPICALYRGTTLPLALVGRENDEIAIDLVELRVVIDERVAHERAVAQEAREARAID